MGPGGEAAAGRLQDAGRRVAVIERELIGGECAYWACIPSKTLLRGPEARAAAGRAAGVSTPALEDRKSTRLNFSHANISYAVFCLKKKNKHLLMRLSNADVGDARRAAQARAPRPVPVHQSHDSALERQSRPHRRRTVDRVLIDIVP